MRKYTANYAFTNPNFVVQNFVPNEIENSVEKSLLFVLRNLLQRGFPTILSQYLQNEFGRLHEMEDFKKPFLLVSSKAPQWLGTIKGDEQRQYFPARDFLNKLLPENLGEWGFVTQLILPEAEINEITGTYNETFVNQQVDFFLPQAKLIIEIDGQQHKYDDVTRIGDRQRDRYLEEQGFKTIRISTTELKNGQYQSKTQAIKDHLGTKKIARKLRLYKSAYDVIRQSSLPKAIIERKIRPTAIIRLQLLLIDLILNKYLSFSEPWKLNLIIPDEEPLGDFAALAVEDLFSWYENLYRLKHKEPFVRPEVSITYGASRERDYNNSRGVLNIDFSLFQRWTDEHKNHPDLIFVRTDYFGAEANYFKVSCTTPVDYKITDQDKPVLEFFLKNVFEKDAFRDGQFPIISNILNREDTIGLLPTGGGKSLCYQLPCLLQPSINFVVCPIKSLMYDQQLNMEAAYVTNTSSLTSDLSPKDKEQVQAEFAAGKYLFIWISPERFQITTFREYLSSVAARFSIAHAVIDEVHCMSEWGHDFRASYLNLTRTIQKFCPGSKFIGLTATASVNVLKDIRVEFARNKLALNDQNIKSLLDYSRKELEFEVIKTNDKFKDVEAFLEDTNVLEQERDAALVFTPHVNGTLGCYSLSNRIGSKHKGKVSWYSGEVPKFSASCFVNEHELKNPVFLEERIRDAMRSQGATPDLIEQTISQKNYAHRPTKNPGNFYVTIGKGHPVLNEAAFKEHKSSIQKRFKHNEIPMLVATKAFGMGIDKNNIKYTIHYGIPGSVESLYQEAGRAGRWVDKSKKAVCRTLYTPETIDQQIVDEIFKSQTPISEIKSIFRELGWNGGKDMVKNLQLALSNQRDVVEDFKIMNLVVGNYFRAESKEKIWHQNIIKELKGIGIEGTEADLLSAVEKSIYRLRLLGVVEDWTKDFRTHFEVQFVSKTDKHIYNSLFNFLVKYVPDIDLQPILAKMPQPTLLEKAIGYLLKWSYENISYSRRQSLKNLVDYCDQFENSEAFKRRIDNYFQFTETTFVYQHVGEHPLDYNKWFQTFYLDDNIPNPTQLPEERGKVFIPSIKDEDTRRLELERLRDSVARFLESYRENVGLNFISGMIRLLLDEYEDQDGRSRLEQALQYIKDRFDELQQEEIIQWMLETGDHTNETVQEKLASTITKFYPERLETIAEYYGLVYLLDDPITTQLQKIKKLNEELHEGLEQIAAL